MNAQQEKQIDEALKEDARRLDLGRKMRGVEPCETQGLTYGISRDSAKNLLQHKYEEALKRANNLHTIMQMLPTTLTQQQDDALWSILNNL